MGTLDKVKGLVENPPKEYRSAPFWGWNDRLQKENLGEQIEGFKKAGMGGFFIHSREGLETEYLSTEWMEDVKFCVDKARENDLELWIYDEDKWPSGAAGGIGDKTGGGSGMPFTSELPNGWTVRFSASPHFNADMEQIEWGIEPDIKVNMDEADETKHIDTIIEKARAFLKGEWTPAVSE